MLPAVTNARKCEYIYRYLVTFSIYNIVQHQLSVSRPTLWGSCCHRKFTEANN